ncbi:MAG: hypothetical protein KatS3mg057_1007 [Herpetosiphonaceae bacterium]|nr:MAG: hypothetical protein KatS3mg057_1007 [Herpetosiphonaceae bacterium]
MALYLSQFAYTSEAWAALAKNPQNRAEVIGRLLERMGGRLHNLYYCFGEYDGVILFEAPDDTTAVATLIAALSPGHVKAIKTTKLLTVEETMEAMRKAGGVTYQGPSTGR